MPHHNDLLERFQPAVRYDSNEQFFADSAAQYAVNPGNELRRKHTNDGDGEVLASAQPRGDTPTLTLSFLGPRTYGDGTRVRKTDLIGVAGKQYRAQYRRLRLDRPDLKNVLYARAVEANGRLWLQYWLWYFYNDYQLAFGLGTHEGDWEMVQLRMDEATGHPDLAVYAQHDHAEARPWAKVEKLEAEPDRPIIYVARGSHASYFEAGYHRSEAWYDLADGMREAPRLRLEILGDDEPVWVRWPGLWGDTQARGDVESGAPTGPGQKKQWSEPDKLLDDKAESSEHGRGADGPAVQALRAGGRPRIVYDVTTRRPQPDKLVVTVNSQDEAGMPPLTTTIPVHSTGKGRVTTEIVLDSLKRYDIRVSTVAGDPPIPSEATRTDIVAIGDRVPTLKPVQRLLGLISGLVARIRGDRR
ncbi:MAG: Vps62-related protein [Solirubrobacteraceae bacterium]